MKDMVSRSKNERSALLPLAEHCRAPKPLQSYMERLGTRPRKPYIPPTPKPRTKAVTIAVGMHTPEGIILCSDSQITGAGYKYPDKKVFSIRPTPGKAEWSVGLTYSGDPQKMTRIYEQMKDYLSRLDIDINSGYVRSSFETVLSEARNAIVTHSDPDIDALCGFIDKSGNPTLFTGKNGVVSETAKWTILGAGDASLTRYLQKVVPISRIQSDIATGLVVCAYIIKQATEHIDGCGGDLQVCILRPNAVPKSLGQIPVLKYTSALLDALIKNSILFSFEVEPLPNIDLLDADTFEEKILADVRQLRAQIRSLRAKL
jgi:20S proteasome alpha/beta subunit